jgi:hypothetical protein
LLQHIAAKFGVQHHDSRQGIWEAQNADHLLVRANLDGAAAWQGHRACQLLDEFFAPFFAGPPCDDRAHLLAINDGPLLEWLEGREQSGQSNALTASLRRLLASEGEGGQAPSHIRFISLNHRSLVGGRYGQNGEETTDFLDLLISRLLGGPNAREIWTPCLRCSAWERCVAGPNAHRLLAAPGTPEGSVGRRMRQQLAWALQAVHQRGEVHITARELRGTLAYVLFGVRSCRELHAAPDLRAEAAWDMAFDPESPHRQGELLQELAHLDPALEAHPQLDRWLIGRSVRDLPTAGPQYPGLNLESARRRAWMEWSSEQLAALTGDPAALALAGGGHLLLFHEAAMRTPEENAALCVRLCRGVSQLEGLPPAALKRTAVVPLCITPRTPTETVFWVEKPQDRFRLEAEWPRVEGAKLSVLPCCLRLVYRCADGRQETLRMGYRVFHTLLCLADGEQLTDLRSDDLFANLAIFTQRLAQEDEAHLFAWNPKEHDNTFRLGIQHQAGRQVLVCENA